jgi:hypothetical protein
VCRAQLSAEPVTDRYPPGYRTNPVLPSSLHNYLILPRKYTTKARRAAAVGRIPLGYHFFYWNELKFHRAVGPCLSVENGLINRRIYLDRNFNPRLERNL